MAKPKYTVKFFFDKPNGEVIPWEDLTEEEKTAIFKKMSENLSKSMSLYYTQHPDEYELLCAGGT